MIPLSHRARVTANQRPCRLDRTRFQRERERERESASGDAPHREGRGEIDTGSPHSTVSSQRSEDTHRNQDYSRLLSTEVSEGN